MPAIGTVDRHTDDHTEGTMHPLRQPFHRLHRDQRGEGVISTAIAVLIMAVIGAVMYAAFSGTFNTAQGQIDDRISEIGEG